ncbi:MAG: hypothetical protein WCF04_08825, partial [Candidatus Nanopelagicales bacterium]
RGRWVQSSVPDEARRITAAPRAASTVTAVATTLSGDRSHRQRHSTFTAAATPTMTAPITGITHVSVTGYLVRKVSVMMGSTTHDPSPTAARPIAHHPPADSGHIIDCGRPLPAR